MIIMIMIIIFHNDNDELVINLNFKIIITSILRLSIIHHC